MPTLLSLCEVSSPAKVQGRDLSAMLLAGSGARPDSVLCVCNLGSPAEWRMVVTQKNKLVVDVLRRPTHLYDLSEDPYEMRNLVHDRRHAATGRALQDLLNNWIARVG
jgi:arylsulfatase A-like enzyme